MLNFLRKFRRNNMNGKYFKYAIGEIILVVAGILIALSINNWNEERKQHKKSLIFHQRINEDLNRMIEESQALYIRYARILEAVNATIAALEKGKIESQSEQVQIDYAMVWFSRSTYQLPNLLTYQEMKSSGELSLIYDVKLREELANLNSFLIQVEKIFDRNSNAIEDDFSVFSKYLRSHATTANLEVTYEYNFDEMAQDEEFINSFSRLAVHWRGSTFFIKRIHTIGTSLQKQLAELNSEYAQLP